MPDDLVKDGESGIDAEGNQIRIGNQREGKNSPAAPLFDLHGNVPPPGPISGCCVKAAPGAIAF
jgi:hypothetical protein